MNTHNIQFHDTIRKCPLMFFFFFVFFLFFFVSYRKNFVGSSKEFKLAMVNNPSMFELLRFNCIFFV